MEVIAAKLAGHIQHFANNIKVWPQQAFEGLRIDLAGRHAATANFGSPHPAVPLGVKTISCAQFASNFLSRLDIRAILFLARISGKIVSTSFWGKCSLSRDLGVLLSFSPASSMVSKFRPGKQSIFRGIFLRQ